MIYDTRCYDHDGNLFQSIYKRVTDVKYQNHLASNVILNWTLPHYIEERKQYEDNNDSDTTHTADNIDASAMTPTQIDNKRIKEFKQFIVKNGLTMAKSDLNKILYSSTILHTNINDSVGWMTEIIHQYCYEIDAQYLTCDLTINYSLLNSVYYELNCIFDDCYSSNVPQIKKFLKLMKQNKFIKINYPSIK